MWDGEKFQNQKAEQKRKTEQRFTVRFNADNGNEDGQIKYDIIIYNILCRTFGAVISILNIKRVLPIHPERSTYLRQTFTVFGEKCI